MINFRRIITNFFSAAFARIATAVLSVLLIIYMAREWGTENLGVFSTLMAFFVVFQSLPFLGLQFRLSRDIATDTSEHSHLASNAICLALLVSIPLMMLITGIGHFSYPPALRVPFWFVGAAMIPTAIITVSEAVLLGQEHVRWIATTNIIESVIRTLVFAILVFLDQSIASIFFSFFIIRCIAALLYLLKYKIGELIATEKIQWPVLVGFLKEAPVFLGIMICAAAISRMDFLVLSQFGSLEQVGLYTVSHKIFELTLMAPSVIAMVIFPIFSRMYNTDQSEFRLLCQNIVRFNLIMGLPFAIAIAAFASPIINLFFGPQYSGTTQVLQLLVFVTILNAVDQILAAAQLAMHRQKLDLYTLAATAVLFLITLVILVPLIGITGAAIARLFASVVQLIIRWETINKTIVFSGVAWNLLMISIAASAMGAVFYVYQDWPQVYIALAAVVIYSALIFGLKATTIGEIKILLQTAFNRTKQTSQK